MKSTKIIYYFLVLSAILCLPAMPSILSFKLPVCMAIEESADSAPTYKSQFPFEKSISFHARSVAGVSQFPSIRVTPVATQFPYVVLYVSVFDENGLLVEGLTRNDFSIYEKNNDLIEAEREPIICFSDPANEFGISFSLVFDVSSSMKPNKSADAKQAALTFISQCHADDRGSLVTFSDGGHERIVLPVGWINPDITDTTQPMVVAINKLGANGATAVYDGIAKGMDSLLLEESPKAVIVFSDGVSNSDRSYDINEVVARAAKEGVIIYTIGLGYDSQNLKNIAQATGGEYAFAPKAADMTEIYADVYHSIYNKIRHQYLLRYYSSHPVTDAKERRVTVTFDGISGEGGYLADHPPEIGFAPDTFRLNSAGRSAGEDVTIAGVLTDMDAQRLNQSPVATLYYRPINEDDPYYEKKIKLTENDDGSYVFSTVIPASVVEPPGLYFYLHVTDGICDVYSHEESGRQPHAIAVLPNRAPVISPLLIEAVLNASALSIEAAVDMPDDNQEPAEVVFHYQQHDPYMIKKYYAVQMEAQMSNSLTGTKSTIYQAELPASLIGDFGLKYFISTTDKSGIRAETEPSIIRGDTLNGYDIYQNKPFSAGSSLLVNEGRQVVLNNQGIDNPETEELVFSQWTQLNGEPVVLSDIFAYRPSFISPGVQGAGTTLTFQLTTVNNFCIQSTDTVKILVNDTAPQADFSWTPATPVKGEPVVYTDLSIAGYDEIVSWEWDIGGKPISAEKNPRITFEENGVYPVTLTVADKDGSTHAVTHSITVMASSHTPAAGEDQIVAEGQTVYLNATGSSDPDEGDSLAFRWEQAEGTPVVLSDNTAAQSSFTAPSVGVNGETLSFNLTVTDSGGLQTFDTIVISVQDVAPRADFTWSPESPVPDQSVTFNNVSTATTDAIVSYHWDFGQLGESLEQHPSFTFSEGGTFNISLSITDANGTTSVISHSLAVDDCRGDCEADGGCFIASANVPSHLFDFDVLGWGVILALVVIILCRRCNWFLVLCLMFAMGLPQFANAEIKAESFSATVSAGGHMFDDDQNIDNMAVFGMGISYNFTANIGIEALVKAGQSKFHYYDHQLCTCRQDDLNNYIFQLDGRYYFQPHKKWVPYVTAGIGHSIIDYDHFETDSSPVLNYGGGLHYSISDRLSLRADVRHLFNPEDSENNLTCMLGLTFHFGAQKEVAQKPPVIHKEAYSEPEPEKPLKPTPRKVIINEVPVSEAPKPPMYDTVTFGLNRSIITESYQARLKTWADYLNANPDLKAILEGHTCSLGSSAYNLKLSVKRAENVRHYMISQFGIPAERLTVQGFGESRPLNRNRNEAERQLNRRVSIRYEQINRMEGHADSNE